jgi:hypothetical protein
MLSTRLSIFIIFILIITSIIYFKFSQVNIIQKIQINKTINYSYYVCTQILDESEAYLIEWIEYQLGALRKSRDQFL